MVSVAPVGFLGCVGVGRHRGVNNGVGMPVTFEQTGDKGDPSGHRIGNHHVVYLERDSGLCHQA